MSNVIETAGLRIVAMIGMSRVVIAARFAIVTSSAPGRDH
jgi:hypothetical protein